MDERETLAFTVCVYRCNRGLESSRKREKTNKKENWKKKKLTGLYVCVHSL
jgi:hypothetical protein